MADIKHLRGYTVQESLNQVLGDVIRVTPVVSTSNYTQDYLLFDSTEIPNAVSYPGGVSKLISWTIVDYNANELHSGLSGAYDFEIFFHQVHQSMGTVNAQPNVSDANYKAAKMLGWRKVNASDWRSNNSSADGGVSIYTNTSVDNDPMQNMFLKAEPNSTSVYFHATLGADNAKFTNADDLQFAFNIAYR